MGSARDLVFEILAIDGASAVFHKVGTAAEEAGAKVEASGKSFSGLGGLGAMALAGMGAGAVALGAKVIHMAADFQAGMTRLVTSAGESQKNLHMVGEGIKGIAVATATSTKELTDGMYMIESAGFHGAAGLQVLRAAAEGARAEGAPLHEMGDALTTVMKDYHFSAGQATQATNGLIAIVSHGKTTMADLAASIHSVAPYAKAAGISFAEMGGAIATMTMHGVSADQAAQNLRHLIDKLQTPTREARNTMEQFGLSASDVQQHLGERGLTGTLSLLVDTIGHHLGPSGMVLIDTFHKSQAAAQSLHQMLGGMPPELKQLADGFMSGQLGAKEYHKAIMDLPAAEAAMGSQFGTLLLQSKGFSDMLKSGAGAALPFNSALKKMLGDQTSLGVALQLTGQNFGDFKANVAAVGAATSHAGKHVENWSMIQHTFNFKLSQFHEQLEVAGISIGQKLLPAAGLMLGAFTHLIPAISGVVGWLERNKPVAIGLGVAIASVMVPALWGMATAAWAAAAGFIAANIEIVAAVAIIAAIAAAVVYAYEHWKWFRVAVNDTAKAIKVAAEWMWTNGIKPVFDALKTYISTVVIPWWQFLWSAVKFVATAIGNYVSFMWHNFVGPVFNLMKTYISTIVIPWFMFLWDAGKKVFGGIGAVVTGLWDHVLAPVFKVWLGTLKFVVDTWWALFTFLWRHIWNDFGQPIYKFLSQNLPDWFKIGYRLFDQFFIQPWKLGFTLLYQWIWTDFGQKIYNFLSNTLPGWFRTGVNLIRTAWAGFARGILIPVNWVIQNVWDNGIETIWNAAAGVFNGPKLSPVSTISVPGFNRGGQVPGSGSGDIVPALLEPGEFVLTKKVTQELWPILAPHAKGFQSGGLVGGLLGGLGSIFSPLKNLILGGLEAAARAAFGGVNSLLGHIPGAGSPMGQMLVGAVKTAENDILQLLHKKDATSGGPVVAAAKSQLGVPYSWGGGGPDGPSYGFAQGSNIRGFDCSSLMQYAYWQGAHKLLPRTTYEQVLLGRAVASQSALLPGDLVFPYASLDHVMMVAAPGASGPAGMIQAPHTGGVVEMTSFYAMDGGARRILGYRDGGFLGPGEIGLVGEVGPELVTGGRSGLTVHPMGHGSDGAFHAVIELRLDGQVIDKQLVKFQHVGGTLQSSQNEIKRTVVPSARNQ